MSVYGNLIGNVISSRGIPHEVISPVTGCSIGTVPLATKEDIALALLRFAECPPMSKRLDVLSSSRNHTPAKDSICLSPATEGADPAQT